MRRIQRVYGRSARESGSGLSDLATRRNYYARSAEPTERRFSHSAVKKPGGHMANAVERSFSSIPRPMQQCRTAIKCTQVS